MIRLEVEVEPVATVATVDQEAIMPSSRMTTTAITAKMTLKTEKTTVSQQQFFRLTEFDFPESVFGFFYLPFPFFYGATKQCSIRRIILDCLLLKILSGKDARSLHVVE